MKAYVHGSHPAGDTSSMDEKDLRGGIKKLNSSKISTIK